MRERHLTCLDLRDNTIDVEAIGQIASDVAKYHIFGLRFRINQYSIISELLPRGTGIKRYDVEIKFSRREIEEVIQTEMDGIIHFFSHGIHYIVHMRLSADAIYDFKPYDLKIQSYLYTYFAHVIEHDKRVQSCKRFRLPESLSNYYPGSEWENPEVKNYFWVDFETRKPMDVTEPLTLSRVDEENELSAIFKNIIQIKK